MVVSKYEKLRLLGEGTFGVVSLARSTRTSELVAVKKVRLGHYRDGVSVTALREIKLLQEVRHPNVIHLVDVFASGGGTSLNLVLEYCLTDLEATIRDRSLILSPADVKGMMRMLLAGTAALHEAWILHRDLKPGNVLLGCDGELKLADLGLAKTHAAAPEPGGMTHQVITRWYRPPELLYGARAYGAAVDMWSIGCIFAELLLRTPYMPGDSDLDQLAKIFAARGTPLAVPAGAGSGANGVGVGREWPGLEALPEYIQFDPVPAPDHGRLFSAAGDDAVALMDALFAFDPAGRISAADALRHPYFLRGVPAATAAELLAKVRTGSSVKEEDIVAAAAGAAGSGGWAAAPSAVPAAEAASVAPREPPAVTADAGAPASASGLPPLGGEKKRAESRRPPLPAKPGSVKKRRLDFG
ncbi:hypothetical protein I4F81_011724 [Pyropia yezoensis]|uniref:Uncharacterized protein n=1 Tax=Pyropia yezoensis TaxID=2788 RepID=A0ACC3CGM3_PYRYE|nr:hypothetical protein I4F81_011724 [Neopyropia yezoensis]|eukprot:contig_9796_g2340